MNVGPQFADPVARQLYAEIASIEEQHVTHYESMMDPDETWLERWVLQEAVEVYNYYSCYSQETNSRIKMIWERFLNYELGHLQVAISYFQRFDKRDIAEILPATLPQPIEYKSHREYVREVLRNESTLRAAGPFVVTPDNDPPRSIAYRAQLHSQGIPSEIVATGYRWSPGTELNRDGSTLPQVPQEVRVV
jgi:hypothetical protein